MADTYGVMGHPISHSRSPAIHSEFARQTGQDMVYSAIHVMPGEFARAVAEFRAAGGKGLNVTLPFKEEAWELATARTARAERARAVNTLWFDVAGAIHGDNTDGVGLVRDLRVNHGVDIRGRRVLLLGAGGAARGVVGPLLDELPQRLTVANRTASRAVDLAREFQEGAGLAGCGLDALTGHRFDLIINATSASLRGEVPSVPPGILAADGWCYDMMYGDRPTAFVGWGWTQGAAGSVDGLGMLVEQAAESFYIWRGVRPDTVPVIAALRSESL